MADVPAPISSDGRYYWYGDASDAVVGDQITFVGDPAFLIGVCSLTWSIIQRAGDGSYPVVTYSLDGGVTPVSAQVGSEGTPQEVVNESGQIKFSLVGATGILINVTSGGGTPDPTAQPWIVAIAINRNEHETLTWDTPNPYDPLAYNPACDDESVPTDTLANLRKRVLIRLGFANQATNPPPGMASLVNEFLTSAQTYLYRRYTQLHNRRFMRWKMVPGQRFYSLKDNDEDVQCGFTLDPLRPIEFAGIQDTRNVWYPLEEGIDPPLYTTITTPWRPARYEIRQAIEIYPAPDQTYWLWIKGHTNCRTFAADGDKTSLDAELVFLHALANAKNHYGQPDAKDVAAQAQAYRGELIAGTHGTNRYIPESKQMPPATRPTLLHFQGGGVS